MTSSPDDLAVRRRRAAFRSWHRGMREMDLLLGRFSDAHMGELDDPELADYERLLDHQDRDVLSWLTGEIPLPDAENTGVFRRIAAFHTHGGPIHV